MSFDSLDYGCPPMNATIPNYYEANALTRAEVLSLVVGKRTAGWQKKNSTLAAVKLSAAHAW